MRHRLCWLMTLIAMLGCDRSVPTAVPAALVVAPVAAVAAPTPSNAQAAAMVEAFFAATTDKLTPAASDMLTPAARQREQQRQQRCAAAKDDLPAECEADPFRCAQDVLPMTKPVWRGDQIEVGYVDDATKILVTAVIQQGAWKLDRFVCVLP
jgi:hypothetical protein